MKQFNAGDIDLVKKLGNEYKKAGTIHAMKMPDEFEVETNEGILKGKAGDYLATDGTMHVWPVSAEYMAKYYVLAGKVDLS